MRVLKGTQAGQGKEGVLVTRRIDPALSRCLPRLGTLILRDPSASLCLKETQGPRAGKAFILQLGKLRPETQSLTLRNWAQQWQNRSRTQVSPPWTRTLSTDLISLLLDQPAPVPAPGLLLLAALHTREPAARRFGVLSSRPPAAAESREEAAVWRGLGDPCLAVAQPRVQGRGSREGRAPKAAGNSRLGASLCPVLAGIWGSNHSTGPKPRGPDRKSVV